ncbi:hypothetical protein MLD38_012723 [Melastoma candidum]|uniref:Uncharacterized protein n=1 Tax=Melastoma candidum TaxID=119954 RepID=A0ACB9R799_9MYRT|nr:hypothetical protein MLD38_012723 [Melastoma candidum]
MAFLGSCCTTLRISPFASRTSALSASVVGSRFLGSRKTLSWVRPSVVGPCNGSRASCWFKFGKNGVDAEGAGIYGSQSRDDFDRDDVEQVRE